MNEVKNCRKSRSWKLFMIYLFLVGIYFISLIFVMEDFYNYNGFFNFLIFFFKFFVPGIMLFITLVFGIIRLRYRSVRPLFFSLVILLIIATIFNPFSITLFASFGNLGYLIMNNKIDFMLYVTEIYMNVFLGLTVFIAFIFIILLLIGEKNKSPLQNNIQIKSSSTSTISSNKSSSSKT
jgi:hypothetical protein